MANTNSGTSPQNASANGSLPSGPAEITSETIALPLFSNTRLDPSGLSAQSSHLNPGLTSSSETVDQDLLESLSRPYTPSHSQHNSVFSGDVAGVYEQGPAAGPEDMPDGQFLSQHSHHDKFEAFYDPSSADGYADPSQDTFLTTGSALSGPSYGIAPTQLGSVDQARLFREPEFGAASPLSSPRLDAASPLARSSSFGSDAGQPSPPRFALSASPGADQAWMHSLGQVGNMSISEGVYAPVFEPEVGDASPSSLSPYYQPVQRSQEIPHSDGTHMPHSAPATSSVTKSPSASNASSSVPQLSLGIPTVSVSDASMELDRQTPISAEAAPSIQIMAPSPSTPKAGGRQDSSGPGFQEMLAQLGRGLGAQSASPGSWDLSTGSFCSEEVYGNGNVGPAPFAGSEMAKAQSWNSDSGLNTLGAASLVGSENRTPIGYKADGQGFISDLAGTLQTSDLSTGGSWSNPAKRQDSYDKIRQFLRLDVDMGFSGPLKFDSPTSGSRKRSNSDVGPRSPTGILGPDWFNFGASLNSSGATTATNEVTKADGAGASGETDWDMLSKKVGVQGLFDNGCAELGGAQTVMAMQTSSNNSYSLAAATMDPSLLDGPPASSLRSPSSGNHQTSAHQVGGGDRGAFEPTTGQMRLPRSHGDNSPGVQPSQANHYQALGIPPFSTAGGTASLSSTQDGSLTWRFPIQDRQKMAAAAQYAPNSASLTSDSSQLRRSQSARNRSSGRHRRGARSEDLSNMTGNRISQADFLSRITAPDGGLAPPSSGRGLPIGLPSSGSSPPGGSYYTSSATSRAHPYRTSHDRHHSFSSNNSNSSAGSAAGASPQQVSRAMSQALRGQGPVHHVAYSQTALPTYGTLDPQTPRSPASSIGMGSTGASQPAVSIVTSQATQAASASRRKSEALFSCPVPGCGSTFTRQYNLRGHLRSHADERPFKCGWPGCEKSFARAHDCKRHQNLHLNIKPHTCETCGKTFARLDALNRHHKSDTGGCAIKPEKGDDTSPGLDGDENAGGADYSNGANSGDHGVKGSRKGFGGHVL